MLGIDWRAARATWTAAVVLLFFALLWFIRQTLFIVAIAMMFAYLLYPLFDFVDRRIRGKSRAAALAITYLLVIGLIAALGGFIGTRVGLEASQLAAGASQPGFEDNVRQWRVLNLPVGEQIVLHYREIAAQLPQITLKVLSASSNLIYIVIVPILSFFILKDGRLIRDSLLEMIDSGRKEAEDTLADAHTLMLQYMRSLFFLCLATFLMFSVILSAMRVPYAILLATIAFLFEFIPLVGPLSAAAIIVAVSIFSGYDHVLWVIAFLGIYRLFQDYVLSPQLMSKGVELHPMMVMLGVLAGGELGGVAGIFLSVPTLALLRLLYHRLRKRRVRPAGVA